MTELDRIYEEINRLLENTETPEETTKATVDLIKELEDRIRNLEGQLANAQKVEATTQNPEEKENLEQKVKELQDEVNKQKGLKTKYWNKLKTLKNGEQPAEKKKVEEPVAEETLVEETPVNEEDKAKEQPVQGKVNLNNQINSIIDNPSLEQAISEVPNTITAIALEKGTDNRSKIELITESMNSPVEIPDFISKFMESVILDAGDVTSLTPYLTDELKNAISSAGVSVKRIQIDNGYAILRGDRNVEIMRVKLGEDKPISDEDAFQQISNPVTNSELVEIRKRIKPYLSNESFIENLKASLETGVWGLQSPPQVKVAVQLGGNVKGTVLNEATKKDTTDTDKDKEVPKQTVTGNCEVYINETIDTTYTERGTTKFTPLDEDQLKKAVVSSRNYIIDGLTDAVFKNYMRTLPKKEDSNSFTGKQAQKVKYSLEPGNDRRISTKDLGNGRYYCKFTIVISKGTPKNTVGTGVNKFMGAMTGVSGLINKMAHNGKGANASETV